MIIADMRLSGRVCVGLSGIVDNDIPDPARGSSCSERGDVVAFRDVFGILVGCKSALPFSPMLTNDS